MNYHHKLLEYNSQHHDANSFQSRWCCNEDPFLFRERWDKLFSEFETVDKVDPSKISELYDTMKFDAMHNRQFLEHILSPEDEFVGSMPPAKHNIPSLNPIRFDHISGHYHNNGGGSSNNSSDVNIVGYSDEVDKSGLFDVSEFAHLRELYRLAKILFDFICPQEYGIEPQEKLDIGLLTSLPLVKQILTDIDDMKKTDTGASVIYFTKESHIYTLLNVIFESEIPTRVDRNMLPRIRLFDANRF